MIAHGEVARGCVSQHARDELPFCECLSVALLRRPCPGACEHIQERLCTARPANLSTEDYNTEKLHSPMRSLHFSFAICSISFWLTVPKTGFLRYKRH